MATTDEVVLAGEYAPQVRHTIREMRSSALAELRRCAGPESWARAAELMREVAKYDRWLGEK